MPRTPTDTRALVAIDLGAESCRVSLLRWLDGSPRIDLVHRFANGPIASADESLRWPLQQIIDGVQQGLRLCADAAPEGIRAIAVDGWAVDYVRVNSRHQPLDAPFCYRDERTIAAESLLHQRISPERLATLTGVRPLRINTVYQLYADHLASLPSGSLWLNLPEFLLTSLGGAPMAEYTNASHTGMLELNKLAWSQDIFAAANIAPSTAPPLVLPGTIVGRLQGELAVLPAFRSTDLIAPACHDTASAIAGISASGDDWAYISSGTWSLVGTVLSEPCALPAAIADGFTNLGGVGGSICFHKNVNGMWLLKQCMITWAEEGHPWDLHDLLHSAEAAPPPGAILDVDDPELMLVGNMPQRIQSQLKARGLPEMDVSCSNAGAVTSLILHSLAARYREVLKGIERHTGKKLRRLFVVGGGSKNKMLQRLTAQATGLEVHLGSPESTTVGNFAVQLATLEGQTPTHAATFRSAVAEWAASLHLPQPSRSIPASIAPE